jgi:polyferredoxin
MEHVFGFVSGVLTKLFEALIAPQPVCAAFGILVALAVWANSGRIERFRRDFQSRRSKWSSQKNSLAAWALISILSPILAVEWLAKLITGDLDSLAIIRWAVKLFLVFLIVTFVSKGALVAGRAMLAEPATSAAISTAPTSAK